jgi:acetyl esterase/lipase
MRTTAIIGWVMLISAFLLALLIFVPAPLLLIWMAGLVAKEWSFWLIVAALAGAIMALRGGTRTAAARIATIPLLLITMLLALAPMLAAYRSAAREHIHLSFLSYLFGSSMPPVSVVEGIEFARPDGIPLRLDLYRPEHGCTAGARLPAVVVVHGGAWRMGERSELPAFDRWLAGTGRVVIDVDYRLAGPRARFPAQAQDLRSALGWLGRNADAYCIDTGKVVLLGRSAGGQIVLAVAHAAGDARLGVPDDHAVSVKGVVAIYAPTDLVRGYDAPVHPDIIDARGVLENYLGGTPASAPAAYRLASPVTHFHAGSPPTLLIQGGRDAIVSPEQVMIADRRLTAVGAPHHLLYLPWADHGFDAHLNGFGGQMAQTAILDFLDHSVR